MRELLRRQDSEAKLAIEVYVHRLRASIAAMTAALGGLDALVFTGGVGENSAEIREQTVAGLGYLGVAIDSDMNRMAAPDADVSASDAAARTLLVAAREDLEIARQVRSVLV
jgi:acetate kinase